MPLDKPFIPKDTQRHPAQDFDFLRSKGIEYAQELAGHNWTDYNDHDPGVTILEQLAFAITDLGYRTNMDIKDLMASQEIIKNEGKTDINTFFTAFDILTTNPVTIRDLRKHIIDSVQDVDNVWILPLNQHLPESGLQGIYIALIKVNREAVKEHLDEIRVKEQIKEKLAGHRNLGELCVETIILQEQEVYIKADIELEQNADVEKVHAKVIYDLERYIAAPMSFYTLHEMQSMSLDSTEIFDGPKLYNGFIRNVDLKPKQSIFLSNELINIIRDVDGVKSVKYFKILQEKIDDAGNVSYDTYFDQLGDRAVTDGLIIAKDKVAMLGNKILKDVNHPAFFAYYRDRTRVSLFQRNFDRCYKELRSNTVSRFRKHSRQPNDLATPAGTPRNIRSYHSIQNHFPNIYGLGKDGVPSHFTAERKNYIYQLKGYLYLFEQFLSDYLMQLARFNELFSLDEKLTQSYFTQVPWDIPNIYTLLTRIDGQSNQEKFKTFNEAISGLMRNIDDFTDRRNRFLDHLLARLGDTDDSLFKKFNYYKSQDELIHDQLINKIKILKKYPPLTREKARSFNPRKNYWNTENYAAIEERIRMQLGIDRSAQKTARQIQQHVNFTAEQEPRTLNEILKRYPNLHAKALSTEAMHAGLAKRESLANANEPWLLHGISIDESLFKRGIWQDNLSVLKTDSKSSPYYLLFKIHLESDVIDDKSQNALTAATGLAVSDIENNPRQLLRTHCDPVWLFEFETTGAKIKRAWRILKEYDSEDDAFAAGYTLRNKLLKLNSESEALYLVDHTLLQPRSANNQYSIQFGNEADTLAFQLKDTVAFEGLHNLLLESVKTLRKSEFRITYEKEKYIVSAHHENADVGHSVHVFKDRMTAQEEIEKLKTYFAAFTDLDIQNEYKVRLNHCALPGGYRKEDYNFTISVFLTGWTARFSDVEFRYQVETLIRKYTPAHIAICFHWLALPAMLAFEQLFETWLKTYKDAELFHEAGAVFSELDITRDLNQASHNLIDFVKGKFTINSMADWEKFKTLSAS